MSKKENIPVNFIENYISDKISEAEKTELDLWLSENPDLKDALLNSKKLSDIVKSESPELLYKNVKDKWRSVEAKTLKRKNKTLFTLMRIAAAILIPVTLGVVLYLNNNKVDDSKIQLTLSDGRTLEIEDFRNKLKEKNGTTLEKKSLKKIEYKNPVQKINKEAVYNTLSVPQGGDFCLQLADSTIIWINSSTKIKYPVVFAANSRNIYLEGEAYFEVSKDPKRPFIVHSGDHSVKVYGTKFNVNAYNDDISVKTTLVEGSVGIFHDNNLKVKLIPGQQSVVDKETNFVKVHKVNVRNYTSWKDGLFYFNNTKLSDLSHTIKRWYGVDFEFSKNAGNKRFTGAIEKNKSLDLLLKMIEKTTKIKTYKNGNTVMFFNKKANN